MTPHYTIEKLEAIRQSIEDVAPYTVILAGGAVRDTLHGRSVKDIDVFLEDDRSNDEDYNEFTRQRKAVDDVAKAVGGTWEITSESLYTDGAGNTFATYDVHTPMGDKINLIFVLDWADALASFPDNISRAYLTEDGLTTTPEFEEDHMNKVIRYDYLQGGQERLNRLTAKYPEYEVIKR